jgi:predicted glycoside hydrolase/deacetylase ChbG (UPF0249 family)
MSSVLVINGDDLGKSHEVNDAIFACFNIGLVTNATIMANMPGFEEACRVVHDLRLHENIGIHLNITEGTPLTDHIRRCSLFCDNIGRFCYARRSTRILSASARRLLVEELNAQVEMCKRNGLTITHADSHHHVHTDPGIYIVITSVLKAHGVKSIRISRNIGRINPSVRLAKTVFNKYVSLSGFRSTQRFGSLSDLEYEDRRFGIKSESIELMVHPFAAPDGQITDSHEKRLLFEPLRKAIGGRHLVPYTYIFR